MTGRPANKGTVHYPFSIVHYPDKLQLVGMGFIAAFNYKSYVLY